MGASQQATDRMAELIRIARNAEERDRRLEQLYDVVYRATEWDADRWGFSPDVWMVTERMEMDRRARGTGQLPTEPMMRVRTDAQVAAETGAAQRQCSTPRQAHDRH